MQLTRTIVALCLGKKTAFGIVRIDKYQLFCF